MSETPPAPPPEDELELSISLRSLTAGAGGILNDGGDAWLTASASLPPWAVGGAMRSESALRPALRAPALRGATSAYWPPDASLCWRLPAAGWARLRATAPTLRINVATAAGAIGDEPAPLGFALLDLRARGFAPAPRRASSALARNLPLRAAPGDGGAALGAGAELVVDVVVTTARGLRLRAKIGRAHV